jgi:hypothetical protein
MINSIFNANHSNDDYISDYSTDIINTVDNIYT